MFQFFYNFFKLDKLNLKINTIKKDSASIIENKKYCSIFIQKVENSQDIEYKSKK